MTIVCGDGKRLPAHRVIVCKYNYCFIKTIFTLTVAIGARSEFFFKAMTTSMKESADKAVYLPEPVNVVRMLLLYLYSGEYTGWYSSLWSCHPDRPTIFELHTRVAALAERLLLKDLQDKAMLAMTKAISNAVAWPNNLWSMTVKLFYDEETTLEPIAEATQTARRLFLEETVKRKYFTESYLMREDEILSQYPNFLIDLILQHEGGQEWQLTEMEESP